MNMGENERNACVYVRVSTKDQAMDGKLSLDSQEAFCRAVAERHGYTVVDVAREIFTGSELYARPEMTRVRAGIRAGKYHALIMVDDDRAARNPLDYVLVADECMEHGVELIIGGVPFENTEEGRLIAYVRGYASNLERLRIKERTLRNKKARVEGGKIWGMGPELYGYRRDKERGVRTIYEPEAEVVRQIFEWVTVERLGIRAIVRRLNERDIPPPSDGKIAYPDGRTPHWGRTQVYHMLTNVAYKGETIAWRTQRPVSAKDRQRANYDPDEGKLIRPESEWIRLPAGVTPPIVTPETWDLAQTVRRANRGATARNQRLPRLLRSYIFCGVCGRAMAPDKENGQTPIYRCTSRHTHEGNCGGKRILASAVETWVWQQVVEILKHPDRVAAELQRRQANGVDTGLRADLDRLQATLAKATKKQQRLVRQLSESDDEDTTMWTLVQTEVKRLEDEKRGYQERIAQLTTRLEDQQTTVSQLAQLHAFCDRVAKNLDAFDFEQRRLALTALGVTVTGNKRDWTLRGSIPIDGEALELSSSQAAERSGVEANDTRKLGDTTPLLAQLIPARRGIPFVLRSLADLLPQPPMESGVLAMA